MKTFLLVTGVLFKCINLYAQSTWFPNEATWINTYDNNASNGYTKTIVAGDTLINGIDCKKLASTNVQQFFIDQSIHYFNSAAYVSEANKVVLIYNLADNNFDTLYNLNAVPGDTLPVYGNVLEDILQEVLDTGTFLISGIPLKYLAVQYFGSGWIPVEPDTLVERIGSIHLGILHPNLGAQFGMETFCSYSDDLLGPYTPSGANCDSLYEALYVADVNEVQGNRKLQIFPNPVGDQLFITDSNQNAEQVNEVDIYDALGRSMIKMNEIPNSIDASSLPNGMYFMLVRSNISANKISFIKTK